MAGFLTTRALQVCDRLLTGYSPSAPARPHFPETFSLRLRLELC